MEELLNAIITRIEIKHNKLSRDSKIQSDVDQLLNLYASQNLALKVKSTPLDIASSNSLN
jgi:hypothetical protein